MPGTHHIVGTNEVLEGQRSRESGIWREGVGIDNVQESERILGFGCLLFESILGYRFELFIRTCETSGAEAPRVERLVELGIPLRC